MDSQVPNAFPGGMQRFGSLMGRVGEGAYGAAAWGARMGGRMLGAAGGPGGLAAGATMLGANLLGGGIRAAHGAELAIRFGLTGSFGPQAKSAVEAYLPGFNRYAWGDVRKYALNPRIPGRYVAYQAVRGMFAGLSEAMNPSIAPPQMYVEAGGHVRHQNDLGASAAYGQQLLGPNSLLSGVSQLSRAQKIALLDSVI